MFSSMFTLPTVTIVVNTDPGRDVDDEVAVGWLLKQVITKCKKYNVHLIIVVKTGQAGIDRLLQIGVKPYTGLDLKTTEINTINIESGATHTIEFLDGTKDLSNDRKQLSLDVQPNYLLSIAQGLNDVVTPENLENLKGVFHQGLLSGHAFNDTNSKEILTYIQEELKHVDIILTTPNESFENLFGTKVFESFQIPEKLQQYIIFDAINMLLKRMAPTLPIGVIRHAEGLVNIRYAETINKPGTNARIVKQIRSNYSGSNHDISLEMRKLIHTICVKYVDSIIQAGVAQGEQDIIKHREETIEYVYDLTYALVEMGLPALNEDNTRLLYSTDGDIVEKYPDVFEIIKKIGFFTPAYDLVAAQKLVVVLQDHGIFDL
jgi:hypothetical protein